MKLEYLFPTFVVLTVAGALICAADEKNDGKKTEAKPITIKMKSLSFEPKKLEIRAGDSVIWTNESRTTHTATSDDDRKTFDTGDVKPGQSSKALTFDREGEFKYHCKVHGKSMSGTIIVKVAKK
jgi:plastocyanin